MSGWKHHSHDPSSFSEAQIEQTLSGQADVGAFRDATAASEIETLAAMLDVSMLGDLDPMPAALRSKVERDAASWLAGRSLDSPGSVSDAGTGGASVESFRINRYLSPWLVAAAAILIAVLAWVPGLTSSDGEVTPEAMFAALSNRPGTIRIPWEDLSNEGVTGEVIWDPKSQDGVLKLDGLARNDPSSIQYQLWIFDKDRKEFTEFDAVDGGVFDVASADGQCYVQIDAKLRVGQPYLFAVTSEPPGGVVKHVDDDEHKILLVAPVPESSAAAAAAGSCPPPPGRFLDRDRHGV